jgi:hypothetical protein
MEFEMCFSNVFSLAPEINDFFRCLRLWNFSTGGKATEWSTFLKTGPSKRIQYIIIARFFLSFTKPKGPSAASIIKILCVCKKSLSYGLQRKKIYTGNT